MPKTKEEKAAEKARRAQIRAWAIQVGMLVAFSGGKRERYLALADQCPAIEAMLRDQADAAT